MKLASFSTAQGASYGAVTTKGIVDLRRRLGNQFADLKALIAGNPDEARVCTSHVERGNWTLRGHLRRFTRLSNGFSRKKDNLRAALALYFAYYNFCRMHKSIRMTPAMAAGIANKPWSLADLLTATQ